MVSKVFALQAIKDAEHRGETRKQLEWLHDSIRDLAETRELHNKEIKELFTKTGTHASAIADNRFFIREVDNKGSRKWIDKEGENK